jgi:hypothetical protein
MFIDLNVNLIEITFVISVVYIEAEDELSACVGGIEVRDHHANDAFVFLVALESRNIFIRYV